MPQVLDVARRLGASSRCSQPTAYNVHRLQSLHGAFGVPSRCSDTYITERSVHPDLAGLTQDFWLFDGDTASSVLALMRYDTDGRFLGAARADDPATIQR